MEKKLILHIGRAKTGTTAIQGALTASRLSLRESGICYPVTGGQNLQIHAPFDHRLNRDHHTIANSCNKNFVFSQEVDVRQLKIAFEAEISGYDEVIVSSEGFQNITDPELFKSFFPSRPSSNCDKLGVCYEIHTICYLREFLSVARSAFSQHAQASSLFCTYSQFFQHYASLNFRKFEEIWRDVSCTVEFASYHNAVRLPKGIVSDFERRIGHELESPTDTLSRNPSISGNLLVFKLLINKLNLHSETQYMPLLEMATLDARFSGGFYIGASAAEKFRQKHKEYNDSVFRLSGDLVMEDYSHAPPLFDKVNWARDLEVFLNHPEFATLKNDPRVWAEDPGRWGIES
jgi:hypothetical protein